MKRSKILVLASSLVLSTLFVGCGGSDPESTNTGGNNPAPTEPAGQPAPVTPPLASSLAACPSGSKRIGNADCLPNNYFTNFSYGCTVSGGTIVGNNICKQENEPSMFNITSAIARLTYSQPQHSTALKPLFFSYSSSSHPWIVFAQDRIKLTYLETSNRGWGGAVQSQTNLFGIPLSTWTNNCHLTSMTGIANGTQITNDGQNAGFVVGNGTQVMKFDTQDLQQVFTSAGELRLGFNVADSMGTCQELKFKFKVTHCEDSNGNSVSCP